MHEDATATKKVCVYCSQNKTPLTREHLFPASLAAKFRNGGAAHYFLDKSPQKFIGGEPTVKDVCASCNNGVLSELDRYACGLYDKYFALQINHGQKVVFQYDYDLLLRWLLKIAYTSDRLHSTDDGTLFYYRKYIINEFHRPRVRLFLDIVYPFVSSTKEELASKGEIKAGFRIDADRLRVGQLTLKNYPLSGVIGRAVILNAFSFAIFVANRNTSEQELNRVEAAVRAGSPGIVAILPDSDLVELTADKLHALSSIASHFAIHRNAYEGPYQKFVERFKNET